MCSAGKKPWSEISGTREGRGGNSTVALSTLILDFRLVANVASLLKRLDVLPRTDR